MFYEDHAPAHFHAKYGEYEITVDLQTGLVKGQFPKRALAHVMEWHELHRDELMDDWNLARERRALRPIAPLE